MVKRTVRDPVKAKPPRVPLAPDQSKSVQLWNTEVGNLVPHPELAI